MAFSTSVQLHPSPKPLFISMKVLERGLGIAPAVVAAAAVEVDEPESLHLDAEADDRLGPLHHHLLIRGGIVFREPGDALDGGRGHALDSRQEGRCFFVGENAFAQAMETISLLC